MRNKCLLLLLTLICCVGGVFPVRANDYKFRTMSPELSKTAKASFG